MKKSPESSVHFVLIGGYIYKEIDNSTTYISPQELAVLYDIPPSEAELYDDPNHLGLERKPTVNTIFLPVRSKGDYIEYKEEQLKKLKKAKNETKKV